MVYYFVAKDGHILYMGKDKFENEKLLKWAWPEDIWFHVDDLSSAHVYLRMEKDETIDTIPKETLEECGQLVKKNSIEGCKKSRVKVVYTEYLNLLKTGDMDVGAVSFIDEKKRKYFDVEEDKEILKRIVKTKDERFPDLEAERAEKLQEFKREKLIVFKALKKEDLEREKKKQEEIDKWINLEAVKSDLLKSNKDSCAEDDFM